MEARSLFIALYLLFPIHCVALDADTVFDILNSKINTEMRIMTMQFAAEKERRIRFENMVRTSLRDLHLALNVSHDEGDSPTVQFHSIETKLEELLVQISEERSSRMEEVRMLEQKLEDQDILLEQEKEIIKDLTSKLEGYDKPGREKDEELKELKAQLNAIQNELKSTKAFMDITHEKKLVSLFVAFQREKMLRSSLTSAVSSLEVKFDDLILTDNQFQNRLLEVENGLESFLEFKDNISTLAESRFVKFDKQVEYLIVNLTETAEKTNGIQNSVTELTNNVTEIEENISELNGMVLSLDCQDILNKQGTAWSGVFRVFLIYPTSNSTAHFLNVYCDMTTQGGGWIVIQRRQDGTVDFYRDWQDYKRGFGSLNSEFWLGLENIHALVADGDWELLINMRDDVKGERYARFNTFSVGPESRGYTLTVGGYSGDAGDSLGYHNGMKFSTKDKDNDVYDHINCAELQTGAWWYKSCQWSNLNGVYGSENYKGPSWYTLSGQDPVEFVEMKIRQKK